tara:strand:+ start:180 stop:365 length:186 start_codon:yes stop_codon:yes gene_type:complete
MEIESFAKPADFKFVQLPRRYGIHLFSGKKRRRASVSKHFENLDSHETRVIRTAFVNRIYA